ncbi:MAG: hypothetical protein MI975_26265 [Cytophagales bacterium]|nr:hypothetical protein [Cytophagales bacterium]
MNKDKSNSFDEHQSLRIIKEMIQVSQRKIKQDGILIIIWGWIWFLGRLRDYYFWKFPHILQMKRIFDFAGYLVFIFATVFTVVYIYRQRKKVTTYIGVSLRYVWISLIAGMSLISMTLYNVLEEANFELQHPVFMVFIAYAVVVTGGIIRYNLLVLGGVAFALLAYISSFFAIGEQLLFESIAWFVAFVIPGHWLYSRRKK